MSGQAYKAMSSAAVSSGLDTAQLPASAEAASAEGQAEGDQAMPAR